MSKNVRPTGGGKGSRQFGDLLSRRPFGVPVGDEDAFRGWFARNLAEQIITSADAGQLDRLEHSAKSLLQAVRQWRAYGVPPGYSSSDSDDE